VQVRRVPRLEHENADGIRGRLSRSDWCQLADEVPPRATGRDRRDAEELSGPAGLGGPSWSWWSAWLHRSGPAQQHACRVSEKRAEYLFALYSGRLADPGDRNPYAGGDSLVLAKLWMRGYMRMLRVRIETGPAMARYREAGRDG